MNYSFEIGPVRPPNEGKDCSLLIRTTRNCPWNRCLFCPIYKNSKFELRSVADIKSDIKAVKWLTDRMVTITKSKGLNSEALDSLVRELTAHLGDDAGELAILDNINNVVNWLASGAKTVFLQDADTMVMKTPELVEILQYLKKALPTVERCSSYARAKTCLKKTTAELAELHEAGLSRLHLGLESGSDLVLEFMRKGVTQQQQVTAGQKIVGSGISLSEYVMPGLGGRRWSEVHALDSAKALSAINPDFIRLRSLIIAKNSPLYQRYQDGEFEELSEDETVSEIALLVKNLDCNSYLISDHAANLLPEVNGQLPQDKDRILADINRYRDRPPLERLRFRLRRRLITYHAIHGAISKEIDTKVRLAFTEISQESPAAESKTEEMISVLKRGYI